ncbi:FKBP-type peptidyl-prolyl isomerase-like protein [Mucilaginibacter gracilis]|uniref:Peptidyl-prolyl cis-trans isomerase n=1 Tax=Mucilaginibacter gracilis TaxID=423350 RepID=A0A495J0S2_9SPHI|nr:FKBP-type peptidyl-prolyl cis-trans isomerase [Mucilaginibacter gracilis]RKR81699.1 FKBP-type peptidyl-prolyl isomerase-like protein [Mucilaginibacter gracilis]
MKQTLYTLVVFCAFGLLSCRKNSGDFTIKQYDEDKIKTYINNNNLSAVMKRDTSGGDTTGIYYQIITPAPVTATPIAYSDRVSFVYTVKSFDGSYSSTDTIFNHTYTYSAYVTPDGLQLAIKSIAKYKGTKIRVLIPSRLAYGINGTTLSGYNTSGTVVYSIIGGNQCLDYTITILDDTKQAAYDDLSIQKYMAANGLTGQYQKTASGSYYREIQVGTGTDVIGMNSTVGVQYTGTLFNGTIAEQANTTDGSAAYTFTLWDERPAWQDVLPHVKAGSKLSIITPSSQSYGQSTYSGSTVTIPAFSCLRYDINVISVSN